MTRPLPTPPHPWVVRIVIFLCVITACLAIADSLCRVAGLDGCGWFWMPGPLTIYDD